MVQYNTRRYVTSSYVTLWCITTQYNRLQCSMTHYDKSCYKMLQCHNKIWCDLVTTWFNDTVGYNTLRYKMLAVTIQYHTVRYDTIHYNTVKYYIESPKEVFCVQVMVKLWPEFFFSFFSLSCLEHRRIQHRVHDAPSVIQDTVQ